MDSACPEKDATEILSDSDHSTKVAPTTKKVKNENYINSKFKSTPGKLFTWFLQKKNKNL